VSFPINFRTKREAKHFWAWIKRVATCDICGGASQGSWMGWAFFFEPVRAGSNKPVIMDDAGRSLEIHNLCPDHAQIVTRSEESVRAARH
jgi:hypothetical protein